MYRKLSEMQDRYHRVGDAAQALGGDKINRNGSDPTLFNASSNPDQNDLAVQRALLVQERLKIEDELVELKIRHKRAARTAWSSGKYMSPTEYSNQEERIMRLGRRHQEILMLISDIGKQLREGKQKNLERLFFEVAKELLDPDAFDKILTVASHRIR